MIIPLTLLRNYVLTELREQLLNSRLSPANIPGPEQEEGVGEVSEQELDDGQADALVTSGHQYFLHDESCVVECL